MNHAHCTWLAHVVEWLPRLVGVDAVVERLRDRLDAVLALALLDLEPARPVLTACYANRAGGRRPRDPVAMLRSLVLMGLLGVTSFNRWVRTLHGHPELAVLCGFRAGDVPGLGTHYDFCHRLYDGPYRRPCAHVSRPSDRFRKSRGRFRRNLKEEKARTKACTQAELASHSEGRVAAEVRKALDTLTQVARPDFQGRLQDILMRCAVIPSAQRGLLGNLARIVLTGDGSGIISGAAPHGKLVCDCPREGGRVSCSCARSYSDPTATWGYDSHRERYFFGYRLHVIASAGTRHDLPLHLALAGAHEPDVVMAVDALVQLVKHFRANRLDVNLAYSLWDKGYDAVEFHRLNHTLRITPLIPLAQVTRTPQDDKNRPRDEHGTPLCPGGARMWRHGYNKLTGKLVFCCPAKRPGRKGGERGIHVDLAHCPNGQLCELKSKMGPIVYLPVAEDPRLNPPIARDSAQFIETYKGRSGSERVFSHFKEPGGLGGRPWRRQHLIQIGALAHALGMHARAWAAERFGDAHGIAPGALAAVLADLAKPPTAEVQAA